LGEKMNSFRQIPLEAITLYRGALEMSGKGNHESALKNLSTAVVLAPKFALAYCEMGRCYEKLGRYPEAVSKFDKVLQIYPSHIEAEMNRNRVLEKMGRKK
jgi:tetratricopeptide (TPR) repeat protein